MEVPKILPINITKNGYKLDRETYRSGDNKPGEQIPDAVECRGNNGGNVVIWSNSDAEHPIECEVEECEVHEEYVPTELCRSPFEVDHGVHYNSVYQ